MPGTAEIRARSASGTAENALSWTWLASSAEATAARSGRTRKTMPSRYGLPASR